MMDIITGKTRPDSGTVFFGSTIDLLRHREADIAQLGIGRKFQKPTVFEHLTVFENLELALKTNKGVRASMLFRLDSAQSDRLAEVLHTIHLADSVSRLAGNLSHGQKQWLEIGMLLMQDPKLLLLDEPVAGMTDEETARTAELFLTLKGKHSLMVVEHDMSFIRTISEIVTVLCDGSVLAQGTLDEVQADERVIEVYLGRWRNRVHADGQEHPPVLRRLTHPSRRELRGDARQGHGIARPQRRGQDDAAQIADGPRSHQERQHRARRQADPQGHAV